MSMLCSITQPIGTFTYYSYLLQSILEFFDTDRNKYRLFVVYLRILGVGFIDFISHAYTGCGHAGFRFDVDDAHDAFIGDDFPY